MFGVPTCTTAGVSRLGRSLRWLMPDPRPAIGASSASSRKKNRSNPVRDGGAVNIRCSLLITYSVRAAPEPVMRLSSGIVEVMMPSATTTPTPTRTQYAGPGIASE